MNTTNKISKMNRAWVAHFIYCVVATCVAGAALADPTLTIFTTRARPPVGLAREPAAVFYVDDAEQLNRWLAAGLPAHPDNPNNPDNEAGAKAAVLRRLDSPDGVHYVQAIGPATEHLVLGWLWGVQAFPAVVVEDHGVRSVVYGTTDAVAARQLWETAGR